MLKEVRSLLEQSIASIEEVDKAIRQNNIVFQVHHIRHQNHGDIASNVAMLLSKSLRADSRQVAKKILNNLPLSDLVERVEVAGPGFINFFLTNEAWSKVIKDIQVNGAAYGCSNEGKDKHVLIEYVSSNPTGPLHVGHGRGAAYGDALARIFRATGFTTECEYYINDAGRQIDILVLSVWLRYLELLGKSFTFPDGAYQGDYIVDLANNLLEQDGDLHCGNLGALMQSLPSSLDSKIDLLVTRMKEQLNNEAFSKIRTLAVDKIVSSIEKDLRQFNVEFDAWYAESSLIKSGALDRVLDKLKTSGHLYQENGAWWFRSSELGDEKDRVVIRANGSHTYFASDIAYHIDKYDRDYDWLINVWGSDHHGYISRIKASMGVLNRNADNLEILTVQFATLYRDGEKIAMSTRSGEFVTLRDLYEEVGVDAARFFYVSHKPEQHMDFDLDLAKTQSSDNPVYYVQYAHARICSVFKQMENRAITYDLGKANLILLREPQELDLLRSLSRYPEIVNQASRKCEPHQIAYFCRELANDFHTYYNAYPFLESEDSLRLARLSLIDSIRQVLKNSLTLLGVTAPEKM
tara:strand:+ start:1372 stop:3108 length:1737 start_codon:yes stop_codon:yes gene_type:complete